MQASNSKASWSGLGFISLLDWGVSGAGRRSTAQELMDSSGKRRTESNFITSVRAIYELQAVLWKAILLLGSHSEAGCPGTEQNG